MQTVRETRETPCRVLCWPKAVSGGWLVFVAAGPRFPQVSSLKMCEDFVALSSLCFWVLISDGCLQC